MNIREKVARAIVKARTGHDPDTPTPPFRRMALTCDGHTLLPPPEAQVPLYTHYLSAADAALATVLEDLSARGLIVTWPDETNSRTPDNPS